ncbi:hypothetical protein PI125_g19336 [Phytophthora idaei]|nr:hypothetical protein PI125_g19336 [Phytophthora idaei]
MASSFVYPPTAYSRGDTSYRFGFTDGNDNREVSRYTRPRQMYSPDHAFSYSAAASGAYSTMKLSSQRLPDLESLADMATQRTEESTPYTTEMTPHTNARQMKLSTSRRERCRINQARYRKRQRQHEEEIEKHISDLQEEIQELETQHQDMMRSAPQNKSIFFRGRRILMDLLPGLRDEHAGGSKRGRPPSALSTNFYRLNEMCNKTMWWTVCKYCYAAHVKDRATVPFPVHVHGRKEAWEKHLSGCLYYVRVTGNAFQSEESQTGVREHGEANKMQCTSPPEFTPAEIIIFWRLLLEYQAEALLPDSFVELMSFKRLLVFLNARCGGRGAMPHRHILDGRVLTEYADLHSIEQRDNVRAIQNRSGGRVNFLSDVWETIAQAHVLGCMVALFGRLMTFGLRPAGDRHDGLATAQQMEGV